jgi:hypothetical protein
MHTSVFLLVLLAIAPRKKATITYQRVFFIDREGENYDAGVVAALKIWRKKE